MPVVLPIKKPDKILGKKKSWGGNEEGKRIKRQLSGSWGVVSANARKKLRRKAREDPPRKVEKLKNKKKNTTYGERKD